jgi:hypothetical protein
VPAVPDSVAADTRAVPRAWLAWPDASKAKQDMGTSRMLPDDHRGYVTRAWATVLAAQ